MFTGMYLQTNIPFFVACFGICQKVLLVSICLPACLYALELLEYAAGEVVRVNYWSRICDCRGGD